MSADEPRWTAGQPSLSEPRRDTGGRTEEEEKEEVKEDGDGGGRGRKRQEEEAKENGDGGGRGRWRQEALRLKEKRKWRCHEASLRAEEREDEVNGRRILRERQNVQRDDYENV